MPSTYILDINDPDPPPIYMDCMYDVQPDESGFVLKWMLDGITIYQWIPPKRPQAIAFFKTRADTTYEIEGDTLGRFRSLKIIRPEFNMTGEFTCSVQTFKSSDKRSAKLQIIGEWHNNIELCSRNEGKRLTKRLVSGFFLLSQFLTEISS